LTLLEDTSNYNEVPLILGSNRDEIKLYMIFDPNFTVVLSGLPIRALDEAYYALHASYKSDAWKIDGVDNLAALLSETPGQPDVYAYRFDWDEEPNVFGIDVGFLLGAAHGMEISFVFNNFDQFLGPQYASLVFSEESLPGRQKLGGSMSSYWAEFAYSGSPGFGRLDSEPVEWAAWDNSPGGDKLVIFDTEADGGIRMDNFTITHEDLKSRLLSETGFTTQQQHCDMYADLFHGTDLWSDAEYATLGAEGCGDYPL
jgi:para-nitrobenzyl esterase